MYCLLLSLLVGVVLGWSWKPQWWDSLPSMSASGRNVLIRFEFITKRIGLAAACLTSLGWRKTRSCKYASGPEIALEKELQKLPQANVSEPSILEDEDLVEFCRKLDGTDGGTSWQVLFSKRTEGMRYTAWRRDPQDGGPTEYKSQTFLENCNASIMRDFFWDDEFRPQWDDLLIQARTLLECPRTGSQVVHWVRKFPIFLKDREYVIGRRIWYHQDTYYCITRGVPGGHPEVPRKSAPRRVDTFYSSWRIRPAQSLSGDGMTACEVVLFHHEDMGIQRDLAKLGIRQCMWTFVKKIDPGYRAYALLREQGKAVSKMASSAIISTPVPHTDASAGGSKVLEDSCFSEGLEVSSEEEMGYRGTGKNSSSSSSSNSSLLLAVVGLVLALGVGLYQHQALKFRFCPCPRRNRVRKQMHRNSSRDDVT